ncbi:MAG: hypothetical protein MJE68_26215 [Proteobacteria bacterium]|nr:hypothetical protein [Pseudomonadota bacterium]
MFLRLFFRNAKIRVKSGNKEIEFEGPLSFIKNGLFDLVKQNTGAVGADTDAIDQGISVDVIVSKYNSGNLTGPKLAIFAMVKLRLNGVVEVTRQEILKVMRDSDNYKTSYRGDLAKGLKGLYKKGDIIKRDGGKYALSPEKLQEFGDLFNAG